MTRWQVIGAILIFSMFSGCCSYLFSPSSNETVKQTNVTVIPANLPPVVDITLNKSSGPTPFYPAYSFHCYDPANHLAVCKLMMDGRVYAQGPDENSLFPKNYTRPQFYYDLTSQVGNHTIEIYAENAAGLNASKTVAFTVLPGPAYTKPGWYNCNSKTNPPCDDFQQFYCDKFDPTDISVRQAASEAISKHPGAYSINQLLDIYDWVHTNVFYQNVPITMSPPYYPNQTLLTKSGDCKNQAVLIASMVEAIGGSARVLVIPDCHHAFAEVYVGNQSNLDALNSAVWGHYPLASGQAISWHSSKNAENETENWFIFDTAGGWFPGNTIHDCLNASQTFELRDCYAGGALNTPQIQGTEFGPDVVINDTKIIRAGYGYHYWYDSSMIPSQFSYCHYKVNVRSLSSDPVNWYVTDAAGDSGFENFEPFSYYHGEEDVYQGGYEFDWNKPDRFYVLLRNNNEDTSITTSTQVVMTCYK